MPYAKDHKIKSKDRILKSALDLFSRYGFDKVSIGQIMRAAKMTHGAFYAHFESKESLFKASFFEAMKNSRGARLVKNPLSAHRLNRLVTYYSNLQEIEKNSMPGPESVLFNEVGNQNASVKKLFEASYDNLKKMIEMRLVAINKIKHSSLSLDADAVTDKARVIVSLLIGAVAVAKTITQEDEKRCILESAQKQILNLLGVIANEVAA